MSQRAKLIEALRNNTKDVRFEDACKIAEMIGFVHKGGGKGPHRAYSRPGEPVGLNFQNRSGKIKPYQARQLLAMVDKYEEVL
jgi:hypothetical protein